MSLLVVYLVPEGIIFAADRNLSAPAGNRLVNVGEAAKVLQWPDGRAILGYVGRAVVEGEPADTWLAHFIDEHADADDLHTTCAELADALEDAMKNVPAEDRGMIVHVARFDRSDPEDPLPLIFYVRDVEVQPDGSFKRLPRFESRDELKEYFGADTGEEIRAKLRVTTSEAPIPWFSFRQGFDLSAFGELDKALWWFRGRLVAGAAKARQHPAPASISDWTKFVKLSVLGYEAYFRAFYDADEQLVGGGVTSSRSTGPMPNLGADERRAGARECAVLLLELSRLYENVTGREALTNGRSRSQSSRASAAT